MANVIAKNLTGYVKEVAEKMHVSSGTLSIEHADLVRFNHPRLYL